MSPATPPSSPPGPPVPPDPPWFNLALGLGAVALVALVLAVSTRFDAGAAAPESTAATTTVPIATSAPTTTTATTTVPETTTSTAAPVPVLIALWVFYLSLTVAG